MHAELHDHYRFGATLIAEAELEALPRKGDTVKIGDSALVVERVEHHIPSTYTPRGRVKDGGFSVAAFEQTGAPVVRVYLRPFGPSPC